MALFTLLALGAAAEAIADSGLDTEAEGKDIGVILSSGIGGLPTIEQHARGEEKGMEKVSPYFVPMAIANMAAGTGVHPLRSEGHVYLPGHGLRRRHQCRRRRLPPHPDGYEPVMVCGGAKAVNSPLGIGALPA